MRHHTQNIHTGLERHPAIQATRAPRSAARSSRPIPRDRQPQQQQHQQPHRPTITSRQQQQTVRGKNCSLPQSASKKGGAAVKTNIDLQILCCCRQPPCPPRYLTHLHFQFYPYRTLQARLADVYTTSGRTGRPFRPNGSFPSYRTASSYPWNPNLCLPRTHPTYPTLLPTHFSRTCLNT